MKGSKFSSACGLAHFVDILFAYEIRAGTRIRPGEEKDTSMFQYEVIIKETSHVFRQETYEHLQKIGKKCFCKQNLISTNLPTLAYGKFVCNIKARYSKIMSYILMALTLRLSYDLL